MQTVFFLEHEIESDRWSPLGLVEAASPAALRADGVELDSLL